MSSHDPLLQRLMATSATQLPGLLAANRDEVLAAFPEWTTLPEAIRGDPRASDAWAQRISLVAQILDAFGHPEPFRFLTRDRDGNPFHRWAEMFARSRALSRLGRHAQSVDVLVELLADLGQFSGPGVDDLQPKVYGALGAESLEAGDVGEALRWTERALEACRANGDTYGIATYRENLQVLEAIHLPTVDPEAGARLLECRRLVVAAQRASDNFDYLRSNELLDDALALVSRAGEQLRSGFAGKIYGLRGWNHHHLRNGAAALADTRSALAECRAAGDVNGVRIYEANLEFLS